MTDSANKPQSESPPSPVAPASNLLAGSLPASNLSAINYFILAFFLLGIIFATFHNRLDAVSQASFASAKSAVELAISLIGVMALWLGLMRVLEAAQLLQAVARKLKPIMRKLFPEVPHEHPAMGAMILNISANFLGLGNAATPMGIKAMIELNRLNRLPGVASNAMCLFLAINTSNVTFLPLGTIGVRAASGSSHPAAIILPSILATTCSTVAAILAALYCARKDKAYNQELIAASELSQPPLTTGDSTIEKNSDNATIDSSITPQIDYAHLVLAKPAPFAKQICFAVYALLLLGFIYTSIRALVYNTAQPFSSSAMIPVIIFAIISTGLLRGVKIYEAMTEGAKQGFETAIRIIPFLVVMLVAMAIFRESGAMDFLAQLLNPLTSRIGIPASVLPMALARPLSGSGAFAIMSSIINESPDSYESFVASTIMGSTETSFYILAVYFGAAGVTRVRHALAASLVADIVGIIAAGLICSAMY